MIIESLKIIDYKEKTAANYNFSDGTNLIVSDGNKKGKSSLLKSIYYTLGFDIRQFPSGWNIGDKVFQLKVKFENELSHSITRQGDMYKVDSDDTPLNSKEYSAWFQEILGIDMKLPNTKTKKLHSVYSSAVILPFYIDQDDSWDGAIYRKVSDSLGQYNDVPKGIFEYLFSISDIEVQELQNKINQYTELIKECDNAIKNLGKVLSNYMEKISDIPEVPEIDKEKLNEDIKHYLGLLNTYTDNALEYRIKLVKKSEKLDLQKQDYDELSQLLTMNKKRHKDIECECKYCHSKLTQEQSLTRLGLNNNEFEIIFLKDKVFKNIENLEREVAETKLLKSKIDLKVDELNDRIKESKELLTIDEYINARAKTVAVTEMEKTVEKEKLSKIDYETKRKNKQAEKKNLLKEKADLNEKVLTSFENVKNKIKVTLSLANSDDFNFLQFKKIDGSGMDKNTKYLGCYLMYFSLIEKYGVYQIPFCMDSFIKNEISRDTAEALFSAIEKYFLPLKNQVFFSMVNDNLKYLTDTKNYHIIQIEEHLLNKENYKSISSQIL
ncbi:hypothetical protein [Lacrimispora sp.]|uniref:hypothetical protein n=1 Tax=Lacrimispora sp. TaxID=2719234 RepID=UPI0028AE52D5|nr:hypothetical protein [Lacrimispora sp.]